MEVNILAICHSCVVNDASAGGEADKEKKARGQQREEQKQQEGK